MFNKEIEYKTIIFSLLDTIIVLIATMFWFWWNNVKTPVHDSIKYTIYITLIFMIYYYIFDIEWKIIHKEYFKN